MPAGRYDADTPRPAAPPACVLVVDDDASCVAVVQAMLRSDGYRVRTAQSGPEALEQVAQGGVDLVLLDVRMPGMSGVEVCERLRADPRHARLPIVFLTAEANDTFSMLRGLEAGAEEYLQKPVARRVLLARVRNLLRLADADRERRLVAQVAQGEKLAALGQLAAGVAHELNNPLGYMVANLQSLQRTAGALRRVLDAYREGPAQGRAMEQETRLGAAMDDLDALVSEVCHGGERVRTLVDDLRTFARVDDALREDADLAGIAGRALRLVGGQLQARARLEAQLGPATVARAPRGRLQQVVLQLLGNALWALDQRPAGPEGHVVRVATWTEDGHAVLRVSDSGCGIPPEALGRVFEPFFTTRRVGEGTGLGLSVSRAVVEALGGTLEVESPGGAGAVFTVRVPCEARAGPVAQGA